MNQLTFWGLLLSLAIVGAYVYVALRNSKRPDLGTAINILISSVGAFGAVRIIGFVLLGDLSATVKASDNGGWWSLSVEDALFLMAGGTALGWVSIQTIYQGFSELSAPAD